MSIFTLTFQEKTTGRSNMAAAMAGRTCELRNPDIKKSLGDFKSTGHRLEKVLCVHGIEFINDSKASNVNSVWYALESQDNPVIWIAGGEDQGNDYSFIENLVRSKVKAIVCIGKDNSNLHNYFKDFNIPMYEAKSMNDAVLTSYNMGKKGDVVLLSPACSSFDLYENYEERGNQFKEAVREL